jgi:hypothetical protein
MEYNKKNIKGSYTAIAMMGLAMWAQGSQNRTISHEPTETEEEKKKRFAKSEIEIAKSNGLKQFFFGENSLYALNKKNAEKKAKKKGWI